jgi:lipid II:glycine glycyltransferase (peptidoglycan interpeptide bridge formation enzyme)
MSSTRYRLFRLENIPYALGVIVVIILFSLLYNILTKQKEIVIANIELQKQLTELDITANSLRDDIQNIREQKKEVQKQVVKKETKIQQNESKKISLNRKPYTDDESMRIITAFLKQRNIPSTYSK